MTDCFRLSLLPLLFLMGCAPMAQVARYGDTAFAPTAQVNVLTAKPTDRLFDQIGEISIDNRTQNPNSYFVQQGKLLGADAVVLMGEKNVRIFTHLIGDRVVSRKRADLWAIAIKYKEGPPQVSEKSQASPPVTQPDVPQQITKPILPATLVQKPPLEAPPLVIPEVERGIPKPEVGPMMSAAIHHYAVVELEKVYTSDEWSGVTNFMIVTRTPSREACLSALEHPSDGEISSECVEGGTWHDKIFSHQPIGDWYMTVQMENSFPWAAVVESGTKHSAKSRALKWSDDRKLEVATALAATATFEAERKGVPAKVCIFSPEGKLTLAKETP